MIKLKKWELYNIRPIEGENYDDCQFSFGMHRITDIDADQCFRVVGCSIWWDGEGFKITKTEL